MRITIQESQGIERWRIAIQGRFGFDIARACVAELKKRPWSGKAQIVFDLVDAEHLESSGLGAMLLVVERMPRRIRPEIHFRDAAILAILQVAHMERHFDLVPVGAVHPILHAQDSSKPSSPYKAAS
jgi:hypothetical protein